MMLFLSGNLTVIFKQCSVYNTNSYQAVFTVYVYTLKYSGIFKHKLRIYISTECNVYFSSVLLLLRPLIETDPPCVPVALSPCLSTNNIPAATAAVSLPFSVRLDILPEESSCTVACRVVLLYPLILDQILVY